MFKREGNAQRLTEKGAALAALTAQVLATLDDGIELLSENQPDNALLIHCDPVLANRWLLPRLDRMEAQPSALKFELRSWGEASDADLVIGFDGCVGFETMRFANDACFALCSPDILRVGQTVLSDEDFRIETKIILGQEQHLAQYGASWDAWKEAMGSTSHDPVGEHTETHGSVELALQAAVHGRGIVLLRQTIADDDLRAGRLVPAFPGVVAHDRPIILSINTDSRHQNMARMLALWLLHEMAAMSDQFTL